MRQRAERNIHIGTLRKRKATSAASTATQNRKNRKVRSMSKSLLN